MEVLSISIRSTLELSVFIKANIDKVIKNKDLLDDESIEARNTSEEHSIDKYADKILKVYRRVIKISNEEKTKKWYEKIKDKITGDINE